MTKTIAKKAVMCCTVIVVLAFMLSALTACSPRLNGTYSRITDDGNTATYVFSKNNAIDFTVVSPAGEVLVSRSCTYTLTKNSITFSDWTDGWQGRTFEIRVEKDAFYLGPDEIVFKKKV